MTHLGDFGEAKQDGDTFGWFGERMRVGAASDLAFMDFLVRADKIAVDPENMDPKQAAASMAELRTFFRRIVHPGDVDRFWALALDNNQSIADLLELVAQLTAARTSRPTRRRSGSPAGRRSTGANSRANSSLRVIESLEERGRPDLAQAVRQAQDSKRGRKAS